MTEQTEAPVLFTADQRRALARAIFTCPHCGGYTDFEDLDRGYASQRIMLDETASSPHAEFATAVFEETIETESRRCMSCFEDISWEQKGDQDMFLYGPSDEEILNSCLMQGDYEVPGLNASDYEPKRR